MHVEYLDGEKINEVDYELANTFKHSNNFDKEESALGRFNSQPIHIYLIDLIDAYQPPSKNNPLQRPSTAPGRLKRTSFVDKLKTSIINTNNISNKLMDIPENINYEKIVELEHDNEVTLGYMGPFNDL